MRNPEGKKMYQATIYLEITELSGKWADFCGRKILFSLHVMQKLFF